MFYISEASLQFPKPTLMYAGFTLRRAPLYDYGHDSQWIVCLWHEGGFPSSCILTLGKSGGAWPFDYFHKICNNLYSFQILISLVLEILLILRTLLISWVRVNWISSISYFLLCQIFKLFLNNNSTLQVEYKILVRFQKFSNLGYCSALNFEV